MFSFFSKPTLKISLVDKGTRAKLKITNANPNQIVTLLYSAIAQVAKGAGVDKRAILNDMLALDSRIKKQEKDLIKEVKYGKKSKKK